MRNPKEKNCQKYPQAWLKKRLAPESDGFWKAFTELLKSNRQQYSQETITALEQWKLERDEMATKKQIKASQKKQFFYESHHNRLW